MSRKKAANWIGLDIGGANIKIADTTRRAAALDFPLWKQPQKLAAAVKKLLRQFGGPANIAVTMTGELADCFLTKRDGVEFICNACDDAAEGARIVFYSVKGHFYESSKVDEMWKELAASNWHALATFAAKNAIHNDTGLIIDIGSTTTDIVPFARRKVCCKGWNDTARLLAGELVYTGVERSSIAGITSELPLRGKRIPVMNELFATSVDAYLLLGDIEENETTSSTADGRSATKANAHARLARMVGGDTTSITMREAEKMAAFIANRQAELIATALKKMLPYRPAELHFTGHGRYLAQRALKLTPFEGPFESQDFGADLGARCAPAIAVAELAQEYFQP